MDIFQSKFPVLQTYHLPPTFVENFGFHELLPIICLHHFLCFCNHTAVIITASFTKMATMNVMLCFLLLLLSLVLAAHATPWNNYQVQSQACGDKLADLLEIVCSGKGYNAAFSRQGRTRRVRRGIVEECCRKSCSPAILELYCQATSETPSNNVPIRKRSDSAAQSSEQNQMQELTKPVTAHVTQPTATQETKVPNNDIITMMSTPKSEENYKLLNLLTSSEHKKHNNKHSLNKITPNDTAEQKYLQDNIPHLRHRNHHHSSKPLHRHRASTKTKRDKNMRDENTRAFQIGIVKPYFAGRAFASYRSSHPVLS